jgi:hypothetical protein
MQLSMQVAADSNTVASRSPMLVVRAMASLGLTKHGLPLAMASMLLRPMIHRRYALS